MKIRCKDDMMMHCSDNVDADGACDDDDCADSGKDYNDYMEDNYDNDDNDMMT